MIKPRHLRSGDIVNISTTELVAGRIITVALGMDPDARASKTGLETLNTNDGEKKPEESNEKCNVDQQRSSPFQTSKDYLKNQSVSGLSCGWRDIMKIKLSPGAGAIQKYHW